MIIYIDEKQVSISNNRDFEDLVRDHLGDDAGNYLRSNTEDISKYEEYLNRYEEILGKCENFLFDIEGVFKSLLRFDPQKVGLDMTAEEIGVALKSFASITQDFREYWDNVDFPNWGY